MGVRIVGTPRDAIAAWQEACAPAEAFLVPDRGVASRVLVEERVVGPEYSVELLVRARRPVFGNVTTKVTTKQVRTNAFPVETGHGVPAILAASHVEPLAPDPGSDQEPGPPRAHQRWSRGRSARPTTRAAVTPGAMSNPSVPRVSIGVLRRLINGPLPRR
ncbi:MAG: hypothetical protein ACRCYU_11525 [Nocardioides sp.]